MTGRCAHLVHGPACPSWCTAPAADAHPADAARTSPDAHAVHGARADGARPDAHAVHAASAADGARTGRPREDCTRGRGEAARCPFPVACVGPCHLSTLARADGPLTSADTPHGATAGGSDGSQAAAPLAPMDRRPDPALASTDPRPDRPQAVDPSADEWTGAVTAHAWLAELVRADAARPVPMPGPAVPPPAFRRPRRADLAELAARVRDAGTWTVHRYAAPRPDPELPDVGPLPRLSSFVDAARADLADLARLATLPADLRPVAPWPTDPDAPRRFELAADAARAWHAAGPQAGQDGPGRADGPTVPDLADHGPQNAHTGHAVGDCPDVAGHVAAELRSAYLAERDRTILGDPDAPPVPLVGLLADGPTDGAVPPVTKRAADPGTPDRGPIATWDRIRGDQRARTDAGRSPRARGTQDGPKLAPARLVCTRWQDGPGTGGRGSCDCHGDACPDDPRRGPGALVAELARVRARVRLADRLAGCRCRCPGRQPGRHLPGCPARADVDAPLTSADAGPVADSRPIPDGPTPCPPCTRADHAACIGTGRPGALSTRACPCAHAVHAPTGQDGPHARPLDVDCPTCAAGPRYGCQDDTGEDCPTHAARRAAAELAQADHDQVTRRARACTCLTRAPADPPCPIAGPERPQDGPTGPQRPQEADPMPELPPCPLTGPDGAPCDACQLRATLPPAEAARIVGHAAPLAPTGQDGPASGPRTRQEAAPGPDTPDAGPQDDTRQDRPRTGPDGRPFDDPAPLYVIPPHWSVVWDRGEPHAMPPGTPPPWRRATRAAVHAWRARRQQEDDSARRLAELDQDGPREGTAVHVLRWQTADGRRWIAPAGTPWPGDPQQVPPWPAWRPEDGPQDDDQPTPHVCQVCDVPLRQHGAPCPTPAAAQDGPRVTVAPGRLYVAPIGTAAPWDEPEPCAMAPYAEPGPDDAALGNPWRDVGPVSGPLTLHVAAELDEADQYRPLADLPPVHVSFDLSGAFRDVARALGVDLAAHERARLAELAAWRRGHMRDLHTRARMRRAGRPLPADLVTR